MGLRKTKTTTERYFSLRLIYSPASLVPLNQYICKANVAGGSDWDVVFILNNIIHNPSQYSASDDRIPWDQTVMSPHHDLVTMVGLLVSEGVRWHFNRSGQSWTSPLIRSDFLSLNIDIDYNIFSSVIKYYKHYETLSGMAGAPCSHSIYWT